MLLHVIIRVEADDPFCRRRPHARCEKTPQLAGLLPQPDLWHVGGAGEEGERAGLELDRLTDGLAD